MKKPVDRDADDLEFFEPGHTPKPDQVVLPSGDVITYEQFRMLSAPTVDESDDKKEAPAGE